MKHSECIRTSGAGWSSGRPTMIARCSIPASGARNATTRASGASCQRHLASATCAARSPGRSDRPARRRRRHIEAARARLRAASVARRGNHRRRQQPRQLGQRQRRLGQRPARTAPARHLRRQQQRPRSGRPGCARPADRAAPRAAAAPPASRRAAHRPAQHAPPPVLGASSSTAGARRAAPQFRQPRGRRRLRRQHAPAVARPPAPPAVPRRRSATARCTARIRRGQVGRAPAARMLRLVPRTAGNGTGAGLAHTHGHHSRLARLEHIGQRPGLVRALTMWRPGRGRTANTRPGVHGPVARRTLADCEVNRSHTKLCAHAGAWSQHLHSVVGRASARLAADQFGQHACDCEGT